MEHCTICGRRADEDERFTHLNLYVIGGEGTNACEDCRMDITNFARNLMSSLTRAKKRARKESLGIGFGQMMEHRQRTPENHLQMTMSGRLVVGPGGEVTNLNMDSFSPAVFADQIKALGVVETSRGDVFKWDEESALWREVDDGNQRALRAYPASLSGFPDVSLDWKFRISKLWQGYFIRKASDGSFHVVGRMPSEKEECSSFCHPEETCSITEDGKCAAENKGDQYAEGFHSEARPE